jgi:hypothetical protein
MIRVYIEVLGGREADSPELIADSYEEEDTAPVGTSRSVQSAGRRKDAARKKGRRRLFGRTMDRGFERHRQYWRS